MTTQECMKRNDAILSAWKEWKNGENYLTGEDCYILAALLNIKCPLACRKFLLHTDGPNHACTSTYNKKQLNTIFTFLTKINKMGE